MSNIQSQRTPNSILRKRANKENENREGGKKPKLRGRRVSFAPDDELETMHLYPKGDRSFASPLDNGPPSEELAARIPLSTAAQNMQAAPHALKPPAHPSNPPLGASLSPMVAPSPMSMELTNNSMDLGFMQPSHAGADYGLVPPAALRLTPAFEFTTSITGAVPALSTLVEEDEDGQEDSGGERPNHQTPYQPFQQSNSHHFAADMTVSMELGGMTPSVQHGGGGLDEGSPVDGFLSPGVGGLRGPDPLAAGDLQALSPTSPYALFEMQRGRGGTAGEDEDGEVGLSADLKGKWGFTPGVDDTLEMDRGRQVMGETTFNHVYGPGTTGEITRALGQAAQGPTGRFILPSRSVIAATANAGLPSAAHRPTGPPAVPSSLEAAQGPETEGAHIPQIHRTPVQPTTAAEMTINLLADDVPGGMWNPPLGATTGRMSVASSKPLRSLHGAHDPHNSVPEAGATTALLGATTALLDGSISLSRAPALLRAAAGGSTAAGGGFNNAATRTMNNFTAQLLADNATNSSGQLQALMQRVSGSQQPAAQGVLGASVGGAALGGGGVLTYHRDDLTSASSVGHGAGGGGAGPSSGQLMQDGTAGSFEFALNGTGSLGLGGAGDGTPLEDTVHSLGGFARPPDLEYPAGDQQAAAGGSQRQQLPAPSSAMAVKAAVAAAAAVPLPRSPAKPQSPEQPPPPPMSLQDFLGLMEIRFLDDMRRRSSFLQPAYGLSLLAPSNTASNAATPLPYGEALESALVGGTHAQLSQRLLEQLAESVEDMQRRAMRTEVAMARDNPPLFKLAQVCDPNELEALRDDMRALKRVCRQRTLLSWKKTRIAQEQAVVSGLRDSAANLDRHLATIKDVLEQGAGLEQSVDDAMARSLERTRQLQEQIQAHQAAHEHETLVNLRAAEVAAANERRATQLEELNTHNDAMQAQLRAVSEQRAALEARLQELESLGGGNAGHSEGVGTSSRAGTSMDSGPDSGETGGPAILAQQALELQLAIQGLQLDLRGHQPVRPGEEVTGPLFESGQPHSQRWSLLVVRTARLTVSPASSTSAQEDSYTVDISPAPGASELAQQLLRACLTGDELQQTRTLPRRAVAEYTTRAMSYLTALRRTVSDLQQALGTCAALNSVRVLADSVRAGSHELTLVFANLGVLSSSSGVIPISQLAAQPPRKVELRLPCGLQLLREGISAGSMTIKAWSPHCVPRETAASAIAEQLLKSESQWEWAGLCKEVQNLLTCNMAWGGCATVSGTTACAAQQQSKLVPTLVTNPLFA